MLHLFSSFFFCKVRQSKFKGPSFFFFIYVYTYICGVCAYLLHIYKDIKRKKNGGPLKFDCLCKKKKENKYELKEEEQYF